MKVKRISFQLSTKVLALEASQLRPYSDEQILAHTQAHVLFECETLDFSLALGSILQM
jgi:hypothetical protein